MPSKWAYAKALESPVFKEAANRSAISDAEYESFMRDFANALDAARAAALEEAARIAKFHYDRVIAAEIRARIDKEPTA